MPPQRIYSKTMGIHNSLETISSTRKIRPKIAPNHANGGRVTRGGFDMYAYHRAIAGQPLWADPQTVEALFQTQFQLNLSGVSFSASSRFRLLATPQTLDVVMMAQQNET